MTLPEAASVIRCCRVLTMSRFESKSKEFAY